MEALLLNVDLPGSDDCHSGVGIDEKSRQIRTGSPRFQCKKIFYGQVSENW
jgi:hypothetical protein